MAMEFPVYPNPEVLLARLVWSQDAGVPQATGLPKGELPPTEEFLSQLADQVGMHSHDLFLIAGLAIPDDALHFDEEASRELPELVRRTLALPAFSRQQLRDRARSLGEVPQSIPPRKKRAFEQYPPGFGSLFVRMLALRNLGWSSAAKVMYMMSGVYLSAATIGAVGRGVKELDAELLNGFAAVLGVPVATLASLTGMHQIVASRKHSAEVIDTAALLWDVRHLTVAQVRQVSDLADNR
ncbi:hypothetical protein [Streptomyces mirabilis]|uniref:hypothetical protein n=1 Tax=Streptomyces mirabilis TaxID=68239 RepID=UPI0036DBCF0A